MRDAIKYANLGLAFLLELCVLAALAFWGIHTGESTLAKIALGVGTPLVAAILWGIFASPRAPMLVPLPWHRLLEVAFFGAGVLALFLAGQPLLAIIFLVLLVVNYAFLLTLGGPLSVPVPPRRP
jgi:hypothetical protein